MEYFISKGLRLGISPGKGRGVFACENIVEGVEIECSPVLVLDEAAHKLLDQTLLHDYIFDWQPDGRRQCCMALGYLSLYNHSFASNCEYFMDYEQQVICIRTVRSIPAGEELTINYNGDWDNRSPLWFEAQDSD